MPNQKIRIRLKGYDHEVVDQSSRLIVDTAQKSGARVSGPIPLPTERNLYTVIRSPHKDKDSREIFLTMQQRVFPAIKKMKYGRLPDFDENGELMETIDAVRENAVHVTA